LDLATPSLRDDAVSAPIHTSFVPVEMIAILASEIRWMVDFMEVLEKA
jgi:hypothetical protein